MYIVLFIYSCITINGFKRTSTQHYSSYTLFKSVYEQMIIGVDLNCMAVIQGAHLSYYSFYQYHLAIGRLF